MRRMNKLYMLLAGWLVFGFSTVATAESERPTNVVMFVIDDLGATDLGCFGSKFYETPNLDKLAASGMRFAAAYAACPVCSPTRASIMTGRYPARVGITDFISEGNRPQTWPRNTRLLPAEYLHYMPLEERTIAEALHDAGYATFFAGKWHLGGTGYLPTEQGFEVNHGGTNGGSPRSYFSPYENPNLKDGPEGESLPIRLANEACSFINANQSRPFFVCMPFYSVHTPLQARPSDIAKYKQKAEELPSRKPNWGREHDRKVRLVHDHPTYAAMIEEMDTAIGIVLDKLKELGLEKNTAVMFTSDNGGLSTAEGSPTSNAPLRAGKGWLYEGGVRTPTIVRWPGVTKPGSMCESPIISNDFFPTLLEITGTPAEPDHHVDGVSFVPLLRGEARERGPMFWHYPHYGNQGGRPGGAMRDGHWKLIEWYDGDITELFDLEADPYEKKNVAAEHEDVVERMKKQLAKWRDEIHAKMPTPNPKYAPSQPSTGNRRGAG